MQKKGVVNHQILVLSLLIVAAIVLTSIHESMTGQLLYRPNQAQFAQCSDLLDNDQDGWIDLQDPGCISASDTTETNGNMGDCADSADNEFTVDGLIDGYDPICIGWDDATEEAQCQDGLDNDNPPDGLIDMADPDCLELNDNDEEGGGGSGCDFDGACDPGETFQSCPTDCKNEETCEEVATGPIRYLDPVSGNLGNSGSINNPWPSLQAVLDANYFVNGQIQSGYTVCLLNGLHSTSGLTFKNIVYADASPVRIMGQLGQLAVIPSLKLKHVDNVHFKQMTITPSSIGGDGGTIVTIDEISSGLPSRNIVLQNLKIFAVPRAVATAWTESQWMALKNPETNGIIVKAGFAQNLQILDNEIFVVQNGINLLEEATVKRNTVDAFINDGIKIAQDNTVLEDNVVTNIVSLPSDNAHHDMVQLSGQVILDNVVIKKTHVFEKTPTHPNPAFSGISQGISQFLDVNGPTGCFDCIIENNEVIVSHNHGISFMGPVNSIFRGNTVYGCITESDGDKHKTPIRLVSKDQWVARDNKVYNNIGDIIVDPVNNDVGSNHILDSCDPNQADAIQYFVDYANRDFHLKPAAPAVDAGDNNEAPPDDFDHDVRPCNGIVDVGADERCA